MADEQKQDDIRVEGPKPDNLTGAAGTVVGAAAGATIGMLMGPAGAVAGAVAGAAVGGLGAGADEGPGGIDWPREPKEPEEPEAGKFAPAFRRPLPSAARAARRRNDA